MRTRSFIYVLSTLVIAFALVGAYVAFRRDSAENARLTAEAPATIENVDVRRAVNPVFGSEYTVDVSVSYRYEVSGREYRRTTRISKSEADAFVPWTTAKVCFDPEDADTVEQGKLFPKSRKCGAE